MFTRILRKSLTKRKSKIAIAVVAVVMGASIASALLNVSFDINEKVQYEFSKFGANLLLVPKSDVIEVGIGGVGLGAVTSQSYINENDLWKIKTISWGRNVLGFSPFLYQVVTVKAGGTEQQAILAGAWFEKDVELENGVIFRTGVEKINPWWEIQGDWIENQNDRISSLVGATVAEKLNLEIGSTFTVEYGDNAKTEIPLRVVGIVTTGGLDDSQIFVNLQVAQDLTGRPNMANIVQVSALCIACPIETIAAEIEEKMPDIQTKTIKQRIQTEMNVLATTEGTMTLVTIVSLAASALGVMTTMTTSVIERKKEIGLLKSIGAENKRIMSLFLSEAAIIGVIGGILGYITGFILAQFIGASVFQSSISPSLIVIPVTIGVSVGVSLLASALPVRRAVKIEPAIVLRGD